MDAMITVVVKVSECCVPTVLDGVENVLSQKHLREICSDNDDAPMRNHGVHRHRYYCYYYYYLSCHLWMRSRRRKGRFAMDILGVIESDWLLANLERKQLTLVAMTSGRPIVEGVLVVRVVAKQAELDETDAAAAYISTGFHVTFFLYNQKVDAHREEVVMC